MFLALSGGVAWAFVCPLISRLMVVWGHSGLQEMESMDVVYRQFVSLGRLLVAIDGKHGDRGLRVHVVVA